ncbi:hypothetical protein ACTG9Q_28870 [Actinokineospora sp. 24-640]
MAAALVRASDTVLLACGEASAGLAAALVERTDVTELTVITGDLSACKQFANHVDRFTVRVPGGVLQHGSLVPPEDAESERPPKAVDIAFLPCHRIDSRGRVHLTDRQRAATATLASTDPRRIVLVSPGDAFEATGGSPWLTLGDCDALITGSAQNKPALDRSRAAGAQILVAT